MAHLFQSVQHYNFRTLAKHPYRGDNKMQAHSWGHDGQ